MPTGKLSPETAKHRSCVARRHQSYAPDHPRVIEATPLCWRWDLATRRAASSGGAQWFSARLRSGLIPINGKSRLLAANEFPSRVTGKHGRLSWSLVPALGAAPE